MLAAPSGWSPHRGVRGTSIMPGLTDQQVNTLLAGPVLACLATVTPERAPYVVPVWQHWEGGAMYIVPRRLSRFVEHLKFEPRVAVSC